MDADVKSTKVAMNILNQPDCNSSYAHPMVVYTEAPDHQRNINVMFKVCTLNDVQVLYARGNLNLAL